MSTRQDDVKLERLASEWLDRYFWRRVFNNKFERCMDRERQLKGIDLVLNGRIKVDEKLKIKGCLNRVYRWPGFEMSLMLNGEVREGWFGGSWAQADLYATIGLYADCATHDQLKSADQITGADVLLTKKNELKAWVESYGATIQELVMLANRLRQRNHDGWMDTRLTFGHGAFHLALSPLIDEEPVNLVIPRESLEKLPGSKRFNITGEKVNRI